MRHTRGRGLSAVGVSVVLTAILLGTAACVPEPMHPDAPPPSVAAPTSTHEAEPTAPPVAEPVATAAPAPTPVDPLRPPCVGERAMLVWAHPDDDLLFAGTRLPHILDAGGCIRTVFLTDGDAGRGSDYAHGRLVGIHHAYDVLRGSSSEWAEATVVLPSGVAVSVHEPVDDTRVSLVFLHLPDGNLNGQGFPATGEVSLAKLAAEKIGALPQLSGGGSLSWSAIHESLDDLISAYGPASFFTHVPGSSQSLAKGDHPDHAITGILARKAWLSIDRAGAIVSFAMGYQSMEHPANLTGDQLTRKIAVFRAYAANDPVLRGCRDDASCLAVPHFGAWLAREYLFSEADLGLQ